MKKIALLLLISFVAFGLNAQNSKRTSAYNYLRYNKLDKAKEAIDDAVEHPKTINDAKTWYYYGNVYLSIQRSEEEKFNSLDPDALEKAYNGYVRSLELDEDKEFTNDINDRLTICAEEYYIKGLDLYTALNYAESMLAFKKAAKINEDAGKIDSLATYNAAFTAELAEDYVSAGVLYEQLVEWNYDNPAIYKSLGEIYKLEGDTAKALNRITAGREKYPNNIELIISESNIYLSTSEREKAIELMQQAIAINDTIPSLYYVIGAKYDEMENREEAEKNYKKAIELDPDYFDPNYNLGAMYVNQAIELIDEANALPLDKEKEYNELKELADGMLMKSVPYLEKADELQPEERYILQTLKDIYTRLNMLDKLKAINDRLNN
nr:tetratricopeptide repeat protein [Bacteroidota bacterium]